MRKIFKQIIGFAVGLGLMFVLPFVAAAAPLLVQQGGTGRATITGIPYGTGTSPLGIVTMGSGVSFSGGTLTATGSGGTVTAVSVVSANGLAGSSSGGTTPALTLSTTITGLLKGNGTAISAATAGTDYVTGSSTNTFTNKTYDTAGTGNSFLINGLAATANTGTGSVVRATSPTLVTPILGIPTSVTLTNATGLPLTTGVTGTLPIANGGTGQTTKAAAFDALSPMTTGGDLIYGGASGTGTRLANGTAGQVLTSAGTTLAPTWATPTTGTVTSVTGTANRITSTGGTTPVIDISASYVGQSSITTLGTIATGVWNGTAIANANLANSTISGVSLGGTLAALTATDSTLTFSGSYTGTTARTVGLNLGQANTWTGQQTFNTSAPILGTITGSTQCVHVNSAGLISGTGSDCATGNGTVTTLSVVSANGFTGSVANPTTTPAITLTTSINSPILSGNGTALAAATTTGSGSTAVLNNTPTLLTPVFTGLPTGSGVASAATASTLVSRDANANITGNNWLGGYTTAATAAGTTTLTVGSTYLQYFTGSTTQTVTLPVASTLSLGHQFVIVNNSTGAVTINSSGGNAVVVLAGGTSTVLTCILTSGTTAASWSQSYAAAAVTSGKILNVSNTLTFTGTDSSSVAFGAGGTVLYNGGALGTPSSGTLTNATGLPVSTGISGLGSGVATWLATPSSANLATAVTDETGSGALVFATSPSFTTPTLGAATASGLTLSGITGSTQCLHVNTSGVVSGTGTDCGSSGAGLTVGSTGITSGTNGRILYDNSGILGELATTGSGNVVLATSPTLTTAVLGSSTATTQSPADNSTKLATTAYVDNAILGQRQKEAVKYSSTAALAASTYNNGASGVGATLTEVGLGALTLDGNTPSVADRVLIKNQVSTFQNGIYNVTTVGSAGVAFVLTRATDFDQASDIQTGDTLFVTTGTTLASTTWTYTGGDSPVMGTDAITFVQAAGPGSYTAGNGITITGVSIAIDTSVTVDKTTVQTLTNKTLTSPTLTTPSLGAATATSINKVTITAPASSSTLTVADGSSLITSGAFALTLTSSATSNATIPAGTNTLYSTKSASIASSDLATSLSDETGTGLVVFGTAPTFASTMTVGTASGTTGLINLKGTTSGTVSLSVADAAGTWTMKLPTSAGSSGQFLTTDGSGNTSWAAATSATFATQDVPIINGTTVPDGSYWLATDQADGSTMFMAYAVTTTATILRLKKDTNTGNFYITHTATLTVTSGGITGIAVVGSSVYVNCTIAATGSLRRYDKADLANVTTMTISGTNRFGNFTPMWSDNTNLYVSVTAGATFDKYTISGTTVTNAANISYTSLSAPITAASDGTSVWFSTNAGTGSFPIKKYPIAGGAATSTTTISLYSNAYTSESSTQGAQLFMATATQLGIGWFFNFTSDTAKTGIGTHLFAITAP